MKKSFACFGAALALAVLATACSSAPPVKTQAYADLRNQRTFEYEFPVVWKAIEETFRKSKVEERDPEEVSELEMRKLTRRTLKTDWAYGKSRDKYQEYKVNGTPRKMLLQQRNRYQVDARKVMGGVEVTVRNEEEVERLKEDGSSAGFDGSDKPDPSRAAEILDRIGSAILAAPPSNEAH